MISWFWLIPTFMAGVGFAFILMALAEHSDNFIDWWDGE